MADLPLLSQRTASDPVATLTGDLPSGRQLRKSCRFCRSRKIRCTGETDVGCLACRNRNQRCVYEPTAAMGRPRKYPRTDYCGDLNGPLPMELNSHACSPYFQQGWGHSTLFMRSLQPHEYEQGPPGSFESAPAPAPWRPSDGHEETRRGPFHLNPSGSMMRHRPQMPTSGGLPIPPNHPRVFSTQNPRGSDGAFLNQMPPAASPVASLGNSMKFHPASTSQTEFTGSDEARFQYSACSSRRISLDQSQTDLTSMDLAGVSFSNSHHSRSQSPHSAVPTEPRPYLLVNTHEIISTCDAGHIFQHFKGTTLHVTTQAHLEFILREYPNHYVPVPPYKHPSVFEPKLYHTMLADAISWFVCGQASVSDRPDSSFSTQESLFIKMLEYDRGENNFQESTIHVGEAGFNPLTQLSYQELDFIYSRWLRANPFAFLFNDATPQSIHLAENSAFLATVIGWHFYLISRSRNYGSHQTPHPHFHIPARCHMPFFEYAEAQLMSKAMCVNRSTLSVVQGLILLGAFRSIDSQPRCGWALLSVAQLLSKEYLSPSKRLKRPRSVIGELDMEENKMLGINWLMCLYKSWTLLSMKFPKSKVHAMMKASPSYLEAFLSHSRMNSSTVHTEWANRMLLNASQILEVFCILQEDPPNPILPDPLAKQSSNDLLYESKLYLVRWLMDTAKMRCQVMGAYDSPPSDPAKGAGGEIRNAHTNTVLAVVFSILALSRLVHLEDMTPSTFIRIPFPIFRDVLKLLHLITAEGADSIVAAGASIHQSGTMGEALLLRILRGLFPYFLILVQAFANTLRDFANASTSDSTHLTNQLLEVIESLGRFASAGLSSYPLDDFQVIEEVRGKVVSLSVTLGASQISASQEQAEALQPPDPAPFLGMAQNFVKSSQPSERIALEPFENKDGSVAGQAQHIPTNGYCSESAFMVGSYPRSSKPVSAEGVFESNNAVQLSFQMSSTDLGGVSSSPPPSDPASSASYPFQSNRDSETKSENLLIPSQGSGLLLSFSDSQGLIEPGDMGGTEMNSGPGVFGGARGADQYFCPLDSSWINQPSLHQIDLESQSQPQVLNSFPRTRTPNHITPPPGSPPGYRLHSPCLDYFPNNLQFHEGSMGGFLVSDSTTGTFPQELIEPSSGFQYDAFTRLETSRPSTPTR